MNIPKGPNKGDYGVREDANGVIDWQSDKGRKAYGINSSGDVMSFQSEYPTGIYLFFHGDLNQTFVVRDLVQNPDPLFEHALVSRTIMADRGTTGFPWFAECIDVDCDGNLDSGALLIPEVLGPGIVIAPSSNLVTTEFGGTAKFNVFLNTQPVADVTIGISSFDNTEGTVDKASLTFTPVDWNIPQTVTITGEDDAIEDGDIRYTIVTTKAASDDSDYSELAVDDVSVTNLDNDGPLVYSADDIPQGGLSIPDYNPANPVGISSTITVEDDVTIVGMAVTLNITHQRPSDLEHGVWLIGPDGSSVKLTNFNGANDVTLDFSGISSIGDWRLEVYDSVKKKTGTLNSWSITIETP